MKRLSIFLIVLLGIIPLLDAQEFVLPLTGQPLLYHANAPAAIKKTRQGLPFVDDFSYKGPYPNPAYWEDRQAYINNTMGSNPVNRGVATLDGLNQWGRPYVNTQTASSLADSLTSVPINLSGYTPTDKLFLSFYAQPQGLGFAPEDKDSLFVYFKNNSNQWIRMWQTKGTALTSFKIYFIAVNDTQFLHGNFQFRFVNIASPNLNDDVWNIDYVKLDANRSINDTISNDIGFTVEPSSILYPYTEMPYRHFIANQSGLKSGAQIFNINNLYSTPQTLSVTHEAKEVLSSTPIHSAIGSPLTVPLKGNISDNFLSYNISYSPPTNKSKVVIEDKYYYSPVNGSDRRINDTISRETVFDNYFAYDDGSAEKSYFLLPAFNYPSKLALDFHLNEPDTIRGLGIHFGAQVPGAAGKFFSIVLYKQLGGSGFNDSIILQEDLFPVMYDTTYNGYSNYALANPVLLDSGTYYIGVTQPANFGSDSLYYGLDVNNSGNLQHLFYNVNGSWAASTVNASIMIRPLVGQYFTPTAVPHWTAPSQAITIYPNPSTGILNFSAHVKWVMIYSLDGRRVQRYEPIEQQMDISSLPSATYWVRMMDDKGYIQTTTLIKQ